VARAETRRKALSVKDAMSMGGDMADSLGVTDKLKGMAPGGM